MSLSYAKILENMAELSIMAQEDMTDDDLKAMTDLLAELCGQEEEKVDRFGKFIRFSEAQEAFLDTEIKLLQAKKRAVKNSRERAKNHYLWVLSQNGIAEANGKHTRISLRRSTATKVPEDASTLPEIYQRITTTIAADKGVIRESLEAGKVVHGCEIVENFSLQVK